MEDFEKPETAVSPSCMSTENVLTKLDVERNFSVIGLTTTKLSTASICSQNAFTWVKNSLCMTDIILASMGPLEYHLSFRDAFLCGMVGTLLGVVPVAFVSTFGPQSGHSTTVINRSLMGWFPATALAMLTVVAILGSLTIELILAGQILSGIVDHGSFSTSAAIVVSAIFTGVVSVIGIKKQIALEDYTLFAQILAMFILSSAATSYVNYPQPGATLSSVQLQDTLLLGRRVLFSSLCMTRSIAYSLVAADVTSDDAISPNTGYILAQCVTGLLSAFSFTLVIGASLGARVVETATWQDTYEKSTGLLIAEILRPLGSRAKDLCGMVLVIGILLRMIKAVSCIYPSLYALTPRLKSVPTPIYPTVIMPACVLFAVLGMSHLSELMTSIVLITGYCTVIWFTIFLIEHFLFRSFTRPKGEQDLRDGEALFPYGLASSASFVIGYIVSVLSMTQSWYIGPLASISDIAGLDVSHHRSSPTFLSLMATTNSSRWSLDVQALLLSIHCCATLK